MKAIFLDDERFPKTTLYDWVILRSVEEVQDYIMENGCPSYISFDNDLQRELEGVHLAQWLIEQDIMSSGTFLPDDFNFNVHSANPIASITITGKLSQYLSLRKDMF